MPDGMKEAAKVVVETSGAAVNYIAAILAALGSTVFGMWKYISSRLARVELDAANAAIVKRDLDSHIADEKLIFQELFRKHDTTLEKIHEIGTAVARIEGKLDK